MGTVGRYRYAVASNPHLLRDHRSKEILTKLQKSESGLNRIIDSLIDAYEHQCYLSSDAIEQEVLRQLHLISSRDTRYPAVQERADRAIALIEQHRKEIALVTKK